MPNQTMPRLTFTIVLILSTGHLLFTQSLNPSELSSPKDHVAFFDTIYQMHQELARRSGPVILAHGWESPEHLALRDSTVERNAYLRNVVDEYLDLHGFPVKTEAFREKRKIAQSEFIRRLKDVMKLDSLKRDSILKVAGTEYGSDVTLRETWPTVMLILGTEPDFNRRCENVAWLRFEWEEGNLPTKTMLAYLRHTYAAQNGKELDIATGSTERERIFMHARELSGCWGN